MFPATDLLHATALFLVVGAVHTKDSCNYHASVLRVPYTVNTSIVPVSHGYNATLTFTVNTKCAGVDSWAKKVDVYTDQESTIGVPDCQVHYNRSRVLFASGCTYDPNTLTVTVTKHIEGERSEVWTLVGTFEDSRQIYTTVNIDPPRTQDTPSLPLIPVLTASMGSVIAVLIIVVVVVCLRRKVRGATPGASSHQPALEEDCYYLHPVSPPAGPTQPPLAATVSGQPQTLRTQADQDEYGYSLPDAAIQTAGRKMAAGKPLYRNTDS